MKELSKYVAVLSLGLLSLQVGAQEKKEIKKEVKLTEVNGEKVLTINTNENGKVTQEEYKGESVDKKMQEMRQANPGVSVNEEVKIEEINGEKTVYITKTIGGVSTTEVYKGESAAAKEKEYEMNGTPSNQPKELKTKKRVEVKKVEKIENK